MIPWYYISFGEDEYLSLKNTFDNKSFSMGNTTEVFEKELSKFIKTPYVVATSSGTSALTIALMTLGIGYGDEVIIPNRTWIATAHAVLMTGAKVVLVDVEQNIPLINIDEISNKITSRTKAIIPVHLGGRLVDMDKINEIAKEYNLFVVEDSAQSLGSLYKGEHSGLQSDIGCFSLSMGKLIATGQGGFCVTKNKKFYEKMKLIRSQGVLDIINPEFSIQGFNFRITDLQSSLGLPQLTKIKNRIYRLKEIYKLYRSALENIDFIDLVPVNIKNAEVPLYVEILCDKRDDLIKYLAEKGIQTRPFYPNLDSAEYLCIDNLKFINSEKFAKNGLFLPGGPDQSITDVKKVVSALNEFA